MASDLKSEEYSSPHVPSCYPPSTSTKILNGKFQKQSISFKLQAILSSMMKFCAIPLPPAWGVNRPFVQHVLPVGHLATIGLSDQLSLYCLCSSEPFFKLNNGLKEEEEWCWQIRNSLTVLNLWKLYDSFLYVACVYRDKHSLYRHSSFHRSWVYCASKIAHFFICFYKLKVSGNPASRKSVSAIFQHLTLYHILVVLTIFPTYSLLLYLFWWPVTTDLWRYYCKLYWSTANYTQRRQYTLF